MNETTALLHLSRIADKLDEIRRDVQSAADAANEFAAWLQMEQARIEAMADPRYYK